MSPDKKLPGGQGGRQRVGAGRGQRAEAAGRLGRRPPRDRLKAALLQLLQLLLHGRVLLFQPVDVLLEAIVRLKTAGVRASSSSSKTHIRATQPYAFSELKSRVKRRGHRAKKPQSRAQDRQARLVMLASCSRRSKSVDQRFDSTCTSISHSLPYWCSVTVDTLSHTSPATGCGKWMHHTHHSSAALFSTSSRAFELDVCLRILLATSGLPSNSRSRQACLRRRRWKETPSAAGGMAGCTATPPDYRSARDRIFKCTLHSTFLAIKVPSLRVD